MPPPIPKVPMVGAYGRGVLHHPFIEYVYFGPSPASARDTLFQLYHNHEFISWSFNVTHIYTKNRKNKHAKRICAF